MPRVISLLHFGYAACTGIRTYCQGLFSQFGGVLTGDPTCVGVQFEPDIFLRFAVVYAKFDIAATTLHIPELFRIHRPLMIYTSCSSNSIYLL